MAVEAAAIGANFSDYAGNAGAFGGNFGVIPIDTKPLENLAAYTLLYRKTKWQQEKQETDAKITQLADLSNIALNDLRGKDKEQAAKEFAQLQKDASEYARQIPKTNQEKIQNELKWQEKYGAFKNNYNSGKGRAVTYQKRYNDIMASVDDAKSKDAQVAILNKEFEDTDIGTKISGVANFKTGTVDVPNPVGQKFQSITIGANENLAVEGSYYNPRTNAGQADATILGIKKLYPKEGTPEFNALPESEKNQAKVQATVESGGKVWVDATEPLNVALKGYINPDGTFDAQSFENDNASNTTLMNAYNALKNYDTYNRDKYTQAKSGVFDDKGLTVKLPPNLNPEDFKVGFVDFAKGVNANQLVQSGMFAKYAGDSFNKKLTETDNELQRAQLAETIRNNKADQYLKGKELKMNEDKWKASQTGGSTQINGAIERAKRIYGDMLKLADKNGVIDPDKVRQLNVEQLKYLGIEVPQERDEEGKIISQGGFKPLALNDTQDVDGKAKAVPYAIQLVNGEVRVLRNARKSPNSDAYLGQFDNTKSTNLYNIGTNILNEELKNAGSKELNSYFGIDVVNGIVSNTDGGSTTVSGTTQNKAAATTPKKVTSKGLPVY